ITVHWYPGQGSLTEWIAAVAARSRGREIWLTEAGAATCNDAEQRLWIDYLLNTFDYGSPSRRWAKLFIYYLWDDTTNCEANLVRTDGTPRPSFIDYQNRALGLTTALAPVTLRIANGAIFGKGK